MRGKRLSYLLAVLFIVPSDRAISAQYDYRFSLAQSEVHLEIGEVEQFDPYAYLLQNRHSVADEYRSRFHVLGEVDVKTMGEYEVSYEDDLHLHVIVEDTTPPRLILQSLSLAQNATFTWDESTKTKVISELSDNETDEASLRQSFHCENIDTSTSGSHSVPCEVSDNSGNITRTDLAVYINAPASDGNVQPVEAVYSSRQTIPAASYSYRELVQIQEVATLVNQIRREYGLSPLTLDMGSYHNVTYLRTREVYYNYSHTRPNGQPCYTIFQDYGILYGSVGENIGRGQQSAREVVNEWMASPSHRENILRAEFTHISIGVMGSGTYKVWVQEFFS